MKLNTLKITALAILLTWVTAPVDAVITISHISEGERSWGEEERSWADNSRLSLSEMIKQAPIFNEALRRLAESKAAAQRLATQGQTQNLTHTPTPSHEICQVGCEENVE